MKLLTTRDIATLLQMSETYIRDFPPAHRIGVSLRGTDHPALARMRGWRV